MTLKASKEKVDGEVIKCLNGSAKPAFIFCNSTFRRFNNHKEDLQPPSEYIIWITNLCKRPLEHFAIHINEFLTEKLSRGKWVSYHYLTLPIPLLDRLQALR